MTKEKAKINDLIYLYTESGERLLEFEYRITHIDRRFNHKLYYEAQSLEEPIADIKFLEECEFELVI